MLDINKEHKNVRDVLSSILGRPIDAVEKLNRGSNSKVYRIGCGNSDTFIAKFYFHSPYDHRDRMPVEFNTLNFLWKNSIKCIPRPIAMDKHHGCAVFEHINGVHVPSESVTSADIENLVEFLSALDTLKKCKESNTLPPASDACFSMHTIGVRIENRFDRLSTAENTDAPNPALSSFLHEDFLPCFRRIKKWCLRETSALSYHAEIPKTERTLSPSDFGFHNSVKRHDNRLVYFDFEYFGWDDPAKMVSDFLYHPAMDLDKNLKKQFVSGILTNFNRPQNLAQRLKIVYPLFGLNWCMILLNEFIPDFFSRREFSSNTLLDKKAVQDLQLLKAKTMLNQIMSEYERFPYSH